MRGEPDVLVVGGGLAGLTVTLALARRGRRVTLVDEPRAGAATRASAGMLAAGLGFEPPAAGVAAAARDHYPGFPIGFR